MFESLLEDFADRLQGWDRDPALQIERRHQKVQMAQIKLRKITAQAISVQLIIEQQTEKEGTEEVCRGLSKSARPELALFRQYQPGQENSLIDYYNSVVKLARQSLSNHEFDVQSFYVQKQVMINVCRLDYRSFADLHKRTLEYGNAIIQDGAIGFREIEMLIRSRNDEMLASCMARVERECALRKDPSRNSLGLLADVSAHLSQFFAETNKRSGTLIERRQWLHSLQQTASLLQKTEQDARTEAETWKSRSLMAIEQGQDNLAAQAGERQKQFEESAESSSCFLIVVRGIVALLRKDLERSIKEDERSGI